MFLDGGLAGENYYDTAVKSSREVNDQLQDLGFLIAHDKCHWSPCQKLDWLIHGILKMVLFLSMTREFRNSKIY